jgi:pimeloyl-ACP methyl ester carboxylesterase
VVAPAIGYKLIGTGARKVLVLHGWFGDERLLEPAVPGLSCDDFTYCCVACRGYGASRHVSGDYTLDEIARDALGIADALGWQRFSLLGHSMGAKAAQKILIDAPARIHALVAVTPVPASAVPFDEAGWDLFSGAAADVAKRAAILDLSTGHRLPRSWIDGFAMRSSASAQPEAFAAYLRAWAQSDFSSAVQGLKTPLLALVGEHDPHLTSDVIRATYLSWYPNAGLEILPGCGHYPMDEVPLSFAAAIERFFRNVHTSQN